MTTSGSHTEPDLEAREPSAVDEETPLLLSRNSAVGEPGLPNGVEETEAIQTVPSSSSSTAAPSPSSSPPPEEDDGLPSANTGGPPKPTFLIDTNRARFRLCFLQIMMTYLIATFDGTIMASSHPVITSHFRASNSASWLSTSFLLTSTAVQPLAGRLSDSLGRKQLYVWSMAIFTAAMAWCALAQSIGGFIAARALCGLGAGGMMTLGAIIISDLVPIE